ncbi:MAG: hypothetical protein V4553_22240 [Bacteroidota bacterium]
MKFFKLLSLTLLLLSACNNIQQTNTPVLHINKIANQLSLLSDTVLSVNLLATPPKGLSLIMLTLGNKVLNVANIDSRLKKGDNITLNYPFKNNQHYALYAVGKDPGREYYDMSAYDFTLDLTSHSILNLRKTPLH